MPVSPVRDRRGSSTESYRPRIISTIGQRPACLVSASVTYVGNNEIYAFGGFDQFTDEVYNHVLRLNLETRQWNLVDNYGDIPGVRMGHTATLWQGDKVLIFGGENEHRAYLSDLIIFDLKSAHWHQPDFRGPSPRGRARHSAVIHDDKLYIIGGISGADNNTILDDFCYLDLKKFEWSRTWRFVPRFDHTCWIWGGRIWVFGGLTEGMERATDIWWLDPRQSPCLDSSMASSPTAERRESVARAPPRSYYTPYPTGGSSGYAANSSSVQMNQGSQASARKAPMVPGSISSLNFVSGQNIPSQSLGTHYHVFSSGCLLDFVTPAVTSSLETSLCALELETMRWEKLADGRDLFNPNYRWHYCVLNQEGTHAWLLGCPIGTDPASGLAGEYLSDVLSIDLKKLGLLGNSLASEFRFDQPKLPTSDTNAASHLSGIGADLARMFDKDPATGSGTDFAVTADSDDEEVDDDVDIIAGPHGDTKNTSRSIFVHRLILEARWPHFARMIASQMAEFHSKKLHIPEPFSVVRAFLYYLYTDSITAHSDTGPSLEDVAGMLVMSNLYDMPRLRLLCRNRLGRELDVDHAAIIWERAGSANEEWLKRRAARFCFTYWGRVVRTAGFLKLKRASITELCQEIDTEGRVLGQEELESVGGLWGARFGVAGGGGGTQPRSRGFPSSGPGEELDEVDEDDEGMEML